MNCGFLSGIEDIVRLKIARFETRGRLGKTEVIQRQITSWTKREDIAVSKDDSRNVAYQSRYAGNKELNQFIPSYYPKLFKLRTLYERITWKLVHKLDNNTILTKYATACNMQQFEMNHISCAASTIVYYKNCFQTFMNYYRTAKFFYVCISVDR